MTTVAVMQPYFVPYAGYFRLFAAADVFVAFDCVQFPRRGWVHRNRFALQSGEPDWLTLPLQKCARDTRIAELAFVADADRLLAEGARRFPVLREAARRAAPLADLLTATGEGTVTDYLCSQLERLAAVLGISRPIVRSSTLGIAAGLRNQDRVIAIARKLGASRYVNSPGGRALYQAEAFARQGLELRFLPPFAASSASILTLLLTEPADTVAAAIRRETILTA